MPKVYAQAHGCPSNTADMEMSLGLLRQAGFEIVDSPDKADINAIFTCTVKSSSEKRMERVISDMAASGKPLIVAGCMPKTEQRMIERLAPDASMLGPDSISHIVEAANAALAGKKSIFVRDERSDKAALPRARKDSKVGVVTIASGCLSNCAYCSVKIARGLLHSYPLESIVELARSMVDDGCIEIQLTSEDNGCYGVDLLRDIAELVRAVCAIEGDFKIRVGMMNPTYIRDKELLDDLIEAYKDPKVSKFLHIPVQSGSDKVLREMKRGYSVADFEKIVEAFRKAIPGIYISTDIIVGFPTETEDDFEKTVELIKKMKPDKVNLSKFGARPGTEAANMKQLPDCVISERSRKVHKLISSR